MAWDLYTAHYGRNQDGVIARHGNCFPGNLGNHFQGTYLLTNYFRTIPELHSNSGSTTCHQHKSYEKHYHGVRESFLRNNFSSCKIGENIPIITWDNTIVIEPYVYTYVLYVHIWKGPKFALLNWQILQTRTDEEMWNVFLDKVYGRSIWTKKEKNFSSQIFFFTIHWIFFLLYNKDIFTS